MDGYTRYLRNGNIKILGQRYFITENNELIRDYRKFGSSCANNLDIIIDGTLDLSNKQSTLLHEILEQLDFMLELRLEHRIIQSLETGLYTIIKDNPGIFDFKDKEDNRK